MFIRKFLCRMGFHHLWVKYHSWIDEDGDFQHRMICCMCKNECEIPYVPEINLPEK